MSSEKKKYTVQLSPTAQWQVAAMSPEERAAFQEVLDQIAENPFVGTSVDLEDLPEEIQAAILSDEGREDEGEEPIH